MSLKTPKRIQDFQNWQLYGNKRGCHEGVHDNLNLLQFTILIHRAEKW